MSPVMTFNGVDMSRFFRIIDIIRPIGNSRSVSTGSAPFLGVNIQQVKIGPKEHTIKFDMVNRNDFELEQLKHELAGVLNVTEPVRIIYGDEPDKYYLGMPIDDITPDNIVRWFQRSEMKLLIPDGVAHSTSYSRVDSSKAVVTSDKMVFPLTNNGTVPAYPIITVNNRADNGYVGLVSQSSVFEAGNRAQPTVQVGASSNSQTVIQQTTQTALDFRNDNISVGFSRGSKNAAPVESIMPLTGEIGTKNVSGRTRIGLMRKGYSQKEAASLSWALPASDAKIIDETIWWEQLFQESAPNGGGFIRLFVTDERDQFLYGVETAKTVTGYDCTYEVLASDGKGGTKIVKLWTFQGNSSSGNPFSRERGQAEISRNKDKVSIYWQGASHTVTIPGIKDKKSAKVHVVFGHYHFGLLIEDMFLEGLLFSQTIESVVTVSDTMPMETRKRFLTGSTLIINSENDTLTLDGLAKNNEVVDGSQWPVIPPGESTLEVYVSDFVQDKPSVAIAFEERWL